MANPVIIGSEFRVYTASTQFTIDQHALTQVGDLVISIVGNDSASDTVLFNPQMVVIEPPTYDWNKLSEDVGDGSCDCHQGIFWRIATTAGATVTNGDISENDDVWCCTLTIRGFEPSKPIGTAKEDDTTVSNAMVFNGISGDDFASGLAIAAVTSDGGDLFPFDCEFGIYTKHGEIQEGTDGNAVAGVVATGNIASDSTSAGMLYVTASVTDGMAGTNFVVLAIQSQDVEAPTHSHTATLGAAIHLTILPPPTNYLGLAGQCYNSYAVDTNGEILSCGTNTTFPDPSILSINKVKQVLSSYYILAVLYENGTVRAFSNTSFFTATDVNDWEGIVKLEVGMYNVFGLRADGTVAASGYNSTGAVDTAEGWTGVKDISSRGGGFGIALFDNGTVEFAGHNPGSADWSIYSDVTFIHGGAYEAIIQRADESAYWSGNNPFYTSWNLPGYAPFHQLSAGRQFAAGIKPDGTVWAYGDDIGGAVTAINTNPTWQTVTEIAVGFEHVLGLLPDGSIIAAGNDTYSQTSCVSTWNLFPEPAEGEEAETYVATKSFGELVGVGNWDREAPTVTNYPKPKNPIPELYLTEATATIYGSHSVGLHENGTVYATGLDASGCVSDVIGLTALRAVAGNYSTVVQNLDKTFTGYGQGNSFDFNASLLDAFPAVDVLELICGGTFTAILLEDGTVQTTDPSMVVSGWEDVTHLAVGDYHLLGLKGDGTVYSVTNGTPYGDVASCVLSWTDVQVLGSGKYGTVGIQSDGTILQDTYSYGLAPIPAAWHLYNDILQVETNSYSQIHILRTDGTVEFAGVENDGVEAAVGRIHDVISIRSMSFNAGLVALRSDGIVYGIGENASDRVATGEWDLIHGDNLPTDSIFAEGIDTRPAAMYYDHLIAINSDGTCSGCGNTSNNQIVVSTWIGIVQVATGDRISAGLQTTGVLRTTGIDWGTGSLYVPRTWTDIIFVACSLQGVVAVDSSGDIFWAGQDQGYGELTGATSANGFNDLIEVAAGKSFVVGLKSDGSCVSSGDDTYGLQTTVAGWSDIVHIEGQGEICIGVDSFGYAHWAGHDTYGTKLNLETLTDVRRVFVDQKYGSWIAILEDGTAVNGGLNGYYGNVGGWHDLDWAACGNLYFWGWSASTNSVWDTQSTYANTVSACALSLQSLAINQLIVSFPNPVFGQTVQHESRPSLPDMEVPTEAQTYSHQAVIGSLEYTSSLSAAVYIQPSSLGEARFQITEIASRKSVTTAKGVLESGIQSPGFASTATIYDPIVPEIVQGYSHSQLLGGGVQFTTRPKYVPAMATCFLEDSAGETISAFSVTLQYSGSGASVHAVVSLPFEDGQTFVDHIVLPLFITMEGSKVFEILEYTTDIYMGGSNKSFTLTCKEFATIRIPNEISVSSPIQVDIFSRNISMIIPGAFDIIPGDTVTVGGKPSLIAQSVSVFLNAENPRSIVYG